MRRLISLAGLTAMLVSTAGCGAVSFITNSKTIDGLEGPARAQGVKPTEVAAIELDGQIDGLETRRLRTRHWSVMPGGVVPIHDHEDRPATIYVQQGEILEFRSDRDEPVLHEQGSLSLEADVVHWWRNDSAGEVVLIATDIVNDR